MADADYVYYATINTKDAEAALGRIDKQATELATKLGTIFGNIENAGKGAFTGIKNAANEVGAIQQQFKELNITAFLEQLDQLQGRLETIGANPVQVVSTTSATTTNQPTTDTGVREYTDAIIQAINAVHELDAAERQAQQTQKARNAELDRAKRIFIVNANSVKDFKNQLVTLINTEGQFVLKLGAADDELDENQRKILRAIQSNKQLSTIYQNLVNNVGRADIAFDQLDFPADKIEKTRQSFLGLSDILRYKLVNAFEQALRKGIEFFKTLTNEASKTAEEFRTTQIAIEGILGNPDAALATFNLIRKESERTGADLTALVTEILPYLTNPLTQIPQIANISRGLLLKPSAILQGKTGADVTQALSELLTGGQTKSLQARFNVPISVTADIKTTIDTQGFEAGLNVLEEYLRNIGVLNDDLNQTLTVAKNRVSQFYATFKGELGTPVNQSLLDFWQELAGFIEENRDELLDIALALGVVAGNLVELAGSAFFDKIASFDLEDALTQIADLNSKILELKAGIETSNTSLNPFKEGITLTDRALEVLNKQIEYVVKAIVNIPRGIVKSFNFLYNFIEGFLGYFGIDLPDTIGEAIDKIVAFFDNLSENVDKTFGRLREAWQQFKVVILETLDSLRGFGAATIATIQNLDDFLKGDITMEEWSRRANAAFEESSNYFDEQQKRIVDSINERNRIIANGENELDTILEERRAGRQVDEPIIPAAGALQTGPNEEDIANTQDIIRKRLELELKYAEESIDLEIEISQKRADIWQNYYDKLKDLDREWLRDREDAQLDFERKTEDLTTETLEKQIDAEKEATDKRIEIEKDYQRKLAELKRKFQFDAQEAIRANDAIAFLRLRRQLEYDRREAEINRDQELADVGDTEQAKLEEIAVWAERKRQELATWLQRELDDINIADARKRQDAIAAREQELRDLALYEKRKRDEMEINYQRDLEDFNNYLTEKTEGEQAALDDLYEMVKLRNGQIMDTENEFYRRRIANLEQFVSQYNGVAGGLSAGGGIGGIGGGSDAATNNLIRQLRLRARQIAIAKNLLTDALSAQIANATSVTLLRQIINDLMQTPSGDPHTYPISGGRAKGGPVQANKAYMVGELGPELLVMGGFGGRVIPMMQPTGFNIPSYGNSTSNITNNTMTVNPSMLDPTQMSPAQMAIMQQAFMRMFGGILNDI